MYRCARCDTVTAPGTPAVELVVETRARRYPERRYHVRGDPKERIDPGGVGEEIVRAVRVCRRCAEHAPVAPSCPQP